MANIGQAVQLADRNGVVYPTGPASLTAGATGVAAGAVSATLPAVPGKTTVLQGMLITCSNAVGAVTGQGSISDGTFTLPFQFNETNNGNGNNALPVPLGQGIQASAINTGITVTVPAITGGGVVSIALWGVAQ